MMRSYWFGDVEAGACTRAEGDPDALADRLNSIRTIPEDIIPLDWMMARECGAVKDRAEYVEKLREICLRIARGRIAAGYQGKDTELIQMVITIDGLDQAVNQLVGRLADWYRILHPDKGWKYRPGDSRKLLARIEEDSEGTMRGVLDGILRLRETRARLAGEISERAAVILPNSSRMVGGLVAARIMTQAGGLSRLAQLPSSSIQVMGARGALFSHLTRGTPPPKHGIIYQHMRVHNAPRDARGKVARVLSGRFAIAARIDYHRGVLDPAFVEEADRMIESAGGRR